MEKKEFSFTKIKFITKRFVFTVLDSDKYYYTIFDFDANNYEPIDLIQLYKIFFMIEKEK